MRKIFLTVLCVLLLGTSAYAKTEYYASGDVYKVVTDSGEVWEYELSDNGDLKMNGSLLAENVTEVGYGDNCIVTVVDGQKVYKTRLGSRDSIYVGSGYKYFIYDNEGFITHFGNNKKTVFVGSAKSEPSKWAEAEIKKAIENGVYTTKAMESYHSNITREQFCELVTLVHSKIGGGAILVYDTAFEDTKNEEVLKAAAMGIVAGYGDGRFCPDEYITREQICAMIVRMLEHAVDNLDGDYRENSFVDLHKISDWALPSVNFAYNDGIMQGVSPLEIAPKKNTTCQEAILLMYRVFEKYSEEHEESDEADLSQEDFTEMADIDREIDDLIDEYYKYDKVIDESDIDEVIGAVSDFAEEKLDNGEIDEYCADEASVWVKMNSGLEYIFTPDVEGLDLGGDKVSIITCQPFNTEYGKTEKSFKTKGEGATDGSAREMEVFFENMEFIGNYDDQEVTLDVIKSFGENQIILWHGHGGYNSKKHSYILIGSECDEELFWTDLGYYNEHREYEGDYLAGRIVFSSNNRVAITHKFIEKYIDSMDNSFIYLGTCLSGKDSVLADSFLEKGARAVIGNSDTIRTVYNQAMIGEICSNLMKVDNDLKYMTLDKALRIAKIKKGANDGAEGRDAYPIIFGDGSFTLSDIKMFSAGGKVVDSEGNPVDGAIVSIYDGDGELYMEILTGKNGGYEFYMPYGAFSVEAKKSGYYTSETVESEAYKSAYVFLGDLELIKKEESENDIFGDIEPVTKKITVYFDPAGGKIDKDSKRVYPGEMYGELPIPTKVGYVFDGWVLEDTGDWIDENFIVKLDYDHTICAKWSENTQNTDIIKITASAVLSTGQRHSSRVSIYSGEKKLLDAKDARTFAEFQFELYEDAKKNPKYVIFEAEVYGNSYAAAVILKDEHFEKGSEGMLINGYISPGYFEIDEL